MAVPDHRHTGGGVVTVRFSASSAERLMSCPGSANLELAIPGFVQPPRQPAKARDTGTDVHTYLERVSRWAPSVLNRRASYINVFQALYHTERKRLAADAVEMEAWLCKISGRSQAQPVLVEWMQGLNAFTPKMMRFIRDCMNWLATRYSGSMGLPTRYAEEKLFATWLRNPTATTPDLVLVYENSVDIIDWKSGTIPVDAKDNSQLMFYAACALDTYTPGLLDHEEVRLFIVQPGHTSTWEVTAAEVRAWTHEARAAEERIERKDLTLKPTDKGCLFCPANPHGRGEKGSPYCPVMLKLLYPPKVDEVAIFEGL